jgi:hypothetical protein
LLRPDNIAITSQREGDEGGGEEDDDGEEKRKLRSFEEVLVNGVGFTKVKRIEVQGEGGELSIFQFDSLQMSSSNWIFCC